MTMLRNCCFFRQKILILLTVTHGFCEVQLTSSALTCGQPAVLNCTVIPFGFITWIRNSASLLQCFSSGVCDVKEIGNMSFSVDVPSSTYTLTINPVEYREHQNDVFQCSSSTEIRSKTFDISVPLTAVDTSANKTQTDRFELTASTNCLDSTENITFEWSCSPVNPNQTVSGICNVSTVAVDVNTSSCDTGGYCTGPGLQKQVNKLTFANQTDSPDTEDVYLTVSVTNTDGTTLATTFPEIFKLRKGAQPRVETPAPGPIVPYVVVPLVLLVIIIVAIVVIKKKSNRCKVSQGTRYVVIITTGNMERESSAPAVNAWIKIMGNDGQQTGKKLLKDRDGTGFKPGTIKTFDLDAPAVGNIERISLGCNANSTIDSMWYVERVLIKVLEKEYTFTFCCYISTDENGLERETDPRTDATNIHPEMSKKPGSHLPPIEGYSPTQASNNRSDTESEGTISRQQVEPILHIASEVSDGEKASKRRNNPKKKMESRQTRGRSANYDNNLETEYPIKNSCDRPQPNPPTSHTKMKKKKKRRKEMQEEGTNS